MPRHVSVGAVVVVTWLTCAGLWAGEQVELSNANLALILDAEDGYAISGLVNRAHDLNFIAPRPEGVAQDRSPWMIEVRDAAGASYRLTAADAEQASHRLAADTLTITWSGVSSGECQANLTVTVTVRLPQGSSKSYWHIEVQGEAAGVLWQVDFPRMGGVRSLGDGQMCVPHYWGRLVRDPTNLAWGTRLSYPQPASMQFLAYWGTEDRREPELPQVEGYRTDTGWSPDRSDAAGLYWAAEDGEAYYKLFAVDSREIPGQLSWWIENIPQLDTWPTKPSAGAIAVGYSMPYDAVVAAFTGDYHEAAAIYRDWAKQQVWCSRGPANEWPEEMPAAGSEELARWVPPWFREVGFWAKFYHEPAKVLPEWAAYRKWLRVPMASHYYRYNIARFDDNYPEQLPPDPYFLEGIRDARDLGVRPLPYINGVIWDTDTQSWIRENGLAAAMKNEAGDIYAWDINGEVFARMCPATEQWRAKMRETAEKLIWEHGVNGVYLDCLAATGARPCYDPSHGHSIRGGNYQGQGNRKLMHDLRAHIRRLDPQASFFTEEIGELYLDVMDGYLTLDVSRSWPAPGEQVSPLFTAVYHPYTINFGSDAGLSLPPEFFAWQMGETFIWGSVPLNSTGAPPDPMPGDPNSEFLREIVQAYYVTGQRFLQGGAWRRIAVRPLSSPAGKCGLELAAQPYEVRYTMRRDRQRVWSGPAVMASAWERDADLAVVMVNITEQEQPVELTVRADKLGLDPVAQFVRTWPREPKVIGKPGGLHTLTLPARSVAIYVITTDVQRASVGRELDDTPWELLTVEDGEFPPIEVPADSLWACSDGNVHRSKRGDETFVEVMRIDETTERRPARGHQAEVHGPAAEGRGLPRDLAEKPFLLLRRLPHAATVPRDGMVVVESGDDRHLSCLVSQGSELKFAAPGLVVARDVLTGHAARALTTKATSILTLPAGPAWECYLVGYAVMDTQGVERCLMAAGGRSRERYRTLSDRLRALTDGPPGQREQALAEATQALYELEVSLSELPGALSPVSPLMRVHNQLRTLAVAHVGGQLKLTAQHRWLAPGIPKELRLTAWGDVFDDLAVVEVVPIGDFGEAGLPVEGLDKPKRLTSNMRVFTPRLHLHKGNYVERMIPVLACARVEKDGQEFYLTDILRLEANRPFEIQGQSEPLTVVAGRTGFADVRLRNWSPYDLNIKLTASGPDGWQVSPEPPQGGAPALKDTDVQLSVTPPVDAPVGAYQVRCAADYSEAADTEVIAFLTANVLEPLRPLLAQAEKWAAPDAADLPQIRKRGKFAIYAEAGERLRIKLTNVRVTHYTDTLTFRLLDPDLKTVAEGSIPVDESQEIREPAKVTGAYYLEVAPGSGSVRVQIENRPVAEMATREDPLPLFTSNITRYFYVPPGSRGFKFGAQDGGPDETARFVLTSPTGRVAFEADGNYAGAEMEVQVRPEEAGKVWTLRAEPMQDVSFWLAGDVCPYLSTSPERVLVSAAR